MIWLYGWKCDFHACRHFNALNKEFLNISVLSRKGIGTIIDVWKCSAAAELDRHLKRISSTWPQRTQFLSNWTNVHLVPCRGGNVNEILYGRNCGMEMMETCESSLKSGTMEQFPFKYPKIFISILLHCGTRDIHTIRSSFKSQKCWEWVRFSECSPSFRSVCSSWRQWVTVSTTLWRKMLQQVQVHI